MSSPVFPRPLSSENSSLPPSVQKESSTQGKINTGVRKTIQSIKKAAVAAGLSMKKASDNVHIGHKPRPNTESDSRKTQNEKTRATLGNLMRNLFEKKPQQDVELEDLNWHQSAIFESPKTKTPEEPATTTKQEIADNKNEEVSQETTNTDKISWHQSAIFESPKTKTPEEPATATKQETADNKNEEVSQKTVNTDKISSKSNTFFGGEVSARISSREIQNLDSEQAKKAKKKNFFSIMRFIKRVLAYIKNPRNPFARKKPNDVILKKVDLPKTTENRLPSDIKLYHNLIAQATEAIEKAPHYTKANGSPRGLCREPGSVEAVRKKVENFKAGKSENIAGDWKVMASFIKKTVLGEQNPAMERIQSLKLNEAIEEMQNREASAEDIVEEVRQRIQTLPPEDKEFLGDLLKLLELTYQKSWAEEQTPLVEEQTSSTKPTSFQALLNGIPSIANVFIHYDQPPTFYENSEFVKFLVDHREGIFQPKEIPETELQPSPKLEK